MPVSVSWGGVLCGRAYNQRDTIWVYLYVYIYIYIRMGPDVSKLPERGLVGATKNIATLACGHVRLSSVTRPAHFGADSDVLKSCETQI